jgi:hypothetical protein
MTESYGAGYRRCLNKFINQIDMGELSKNEKKKEEVFSLFELFYNYLSDSSDILLHPTTSILAHFSDSNLNIVLFDNTNVSLSYFKLKSKQKNFFYNGKRYTFKELLITNELDEDKLQTSLRANYIHTLDASLVR